MVKSLVSVAAFSPWSLKDGCAWHMGEGVVGGDPYPTIAAVVPSQGFPGGSHAAIVSPTLPGVTVPCVGLLLRGFWFWGTDTDLDP